MRAVPRLCEFYPGICLTTEEKARKNLSQGKKNLSQVKKNLSQGTVYILTNTHTNTHLHGQTLQEDSYDSLDPETVLDRPRHENKLETADMLTAAPHLQAGRQDTNKNDQLHVPAALPIG